MLTVTDEWLIVWSPAATTSQRRGSVPIGDFNNNWQLEKLKLWKVQLKFLRQIWGTRPILYRWKIVLATGTDNRIYRCGPQNGNNYISGPLTDSIEIPTQNSGFSMRLDKRLAKWLGQRSTTKNYKIGARNIYIVASGCRSLLQSLVDTFCELAVVENPRFAVGIVVISVILSEM